MGFSQGNRAAKQALMLGRSSCCRPLKSDQERREDALGSGGRRRGDGRASVLRESILKYSRAGRFLCANEPNLPVRRLFCVCFLVTVYMRLVRETEECGNWKLEIGKCAPTGCDTVT